MCHDDDDANVGPIIIVCLSFQGASTPEDGNRLRGVEVLVNRERQHLIEHETMTVVATLCLLAQCAPINETDHLG